MSISRSQLVTLLNAKVITGGRQTTAQKLRDLENAIISSCVNIVDDENVAGGYLGLDGITGKVNTSFISKVTPTGQFLRDDGTWQTVSGGGSGTWGSITGTLSAQTDLQTALTARELLTNKATGFGTLNNTLYPTTQAVANYITAFGYGTGTVTNVTGTTGRITSSGGAAPAIDISASYVGQTSITTLGTITTGTWNAASISTTYTDAKIKGGVGATAGLIPLGTGTANTVTTDPALFYLTRQLKIDENNNGSVYTTVSNGNAGGSAIAYSQFINNLTDGAYLGKLSSNYNPYKNWNSRDFIFYTDTGNISFLNDNSSGNINFAAGGSNTANLTLNSTLLTVAVGNGNGISLTGSDVYLKAGSSSNITFNISGIGATAINGTSVIFNSDLVYANGQVFGALYSYNFADYKFKSTISGGINYLYVNHSGVAGVNNRIGIATSTPLAMLEIGAGSTAVAPLKLNSGTLTTGGNILAGQIEFLNDKYYGTLTTGPTRKTFAFVEDTIKNIFDHYADAGNATTIETTLYTDTLAASILGTNGDKINAEYGGVFVSSATATREIKIYFGGIVIFDTGALTLSLSSAWTAYVTITRVSATIVRYMVSFATEGAALSAYTSVGELTGLTLSGTNILKITGQAGGVGAATNDIVAALGNGYFSPAV